MAPSVSCENNTESDDPCRGPWLINATITKTLSQWWGTGDSQIDDTHTHTHAQQVHNSRASGWDMQFPIWGALSFQRADLFHKSIIGLHSIDSRLSVYHLFTGNMYVATHILFKFFLNPPFVNVVCWSG
jgi:hypothetical protein